MTIGLRKRPMQQRLKQLLRLTFCFALLRPQPIKLLDDAGEICRGDVVIYSNFKIWITCGTRRVSRNRMMNKPSRVKIPMGEKMT